LSEKIASLIDAPRPVSGVEGREHVLEVLRRRGVRDPAAERERVAGDERLPGGALGDLDVLEPERGARSHGDRGVDRQRLDDLVELHAQHGDRAPALALGLDRLDDADAEAAEANLVALDQLGAAGHLGADVVGRHERQAGVRVVGDEDGDDRDERGHRADEHRARDDRGCRLA
jgi:hypothetical protein